MSKVQSADNMVGLHAAGVISTAALVRFLISEAMASASEAAAAAYALRAARLIDLYNLSVQ
jgi:hypothetical protein